MKQKTPYQERMEALRIQREIMAFSERCHKYALTPAGAARAELLSDAVWDDAIYNYGYVESEDAA